MLSFSAASFEDSVYVEVCFPSSVEVVKVDIPHGDLFVEAARVDFAVGLRVHHRRYFGAFAPGILGLEGVVSLVCSFLCWIGSLC